MQLAIRDSFKDVPGINNLLKKTKKIAKFTTKSSKAMDKLKAKNKTLNKKFRKPKTTEN